jgi:hypothetical protein
MSVASTLKKWVAEHMLLAFSQPRTFFEANGTLTNKQVQRVFILGVKNIAR